MKVRIRISLVLHWLRERLFVEENFRNFLRSLKFITLLNDLIVIFYSNLWENLRENHHLYNLSHSILCQQLIWILSWERSRKKLFLTDRDRTFQFGRRIPNRNFCLIIHFLVFPTKYYRCGYYKEFRLFFN